MENVECSTFSTDTPELPESAGHGESESHKRPNGELNSSPSSDKEQERESSRALPDAEEGDEALDLHIDLPAELQDQLDMLQLHYWYECRALVCLVCGPEKRVKDPWIRTMLSKNDVWTHLRSFHNYASDGQLRAVQRCLDRLPLLAENSGETRKPVRNLEPRGFLGKPVNGWACSMCDFVTESDSENRFHAEYRHHALLKREKIPPHQVRVQHVDGIYFPVLGGGIVHEMENVEPATHESEIQGSSTAPTTWPPGTSRGPTSSPDNTAREDAGDAVVAENRITKGALPPWLRHWHECRAIVCTRCEDQPLLCIETLREHLGSHHKSDEDARFDLDAVLESKMLAPTIEDMRPPRGLQKPFAFLRPPVYGWSCSARGCGFAHSVETKVRGHEKEVHAATHRDDDDDDNTTTEPVALVQYVSLLHESVFFPVQILEEGRKSETPKSVAGLSQTAPPAAESSWIQALSDFSLRQEDRRRFDVDDNVSTGHTDSVISGETTSHRSLNPGKDVFTQAERAEALAQLWQRPKPDDLKPLPEPLVLKRCRQLALGDGDDRIRAFRRFDIAIVQALLWTQHEIVLLEERMSQSDFSGGAMDRLTRHLENYASLVKSFRELSTLRQPSDKDSRTIGRRLATGFHEPRYWYSPDALDLIDIRAEEDKVSTESPDRLRTLLQRKVPKSFLDKTGKDRRELDDIKEKGVLPTGGMAKIIEAHRRHGRHISPAVDNMARVAFAVLGGLFLLAPMALMSYINSKEYLVVITVLFTLLVAVVLGLASRATNQELLGATAAYAAVLTVFVGNAIKL